MWQLILGPILGLVGSTTQSYFDLKKSRLESEERNKDRIHQKEMLRLESELNIKEISVEQKFELDKIDAKTFSDSYKFGTDNLIKDDSKLTNGQRWWFVLIEVFTRLIRPSSTTFYQVVNVGFCIYFGYLLNKFGTTVFTENNIAELFKEMIYSMIGLGETTLLWWYGARGLSKRSNNIQ